MQINVSLNPFGNSSYYPQGREVGNLPIDAVFAEMNRHHYSLYVHGCRLIFLLRQDPSEEKKYRPAEFHWKLNQVSKWKPGQVLSYLGM